MKFYLRQLSILNVYFSSSKMYRLRISGVGIRQEPWRETGEKPRPCFRDSHGYVKMSSVKLSSYVELMDQRS